MRENKKKKRREGDIGNVKKKCKGECDIEGLSGLNRMNLNNESTERVFSLRIR